MTIATAAELTREAAIIPAQSALLFIDVQNYNALPEGGEYQEAGS